jgi:hypothetical protein
VKPYLKKRIELKLMDDLLFLVDRMKNHNFNFDYKTCYYF